jgi:hypothetical protein
VWFPGDLWPLGQARRVIPAVLGETVGNLVLDPWSVVKAADLARRADLRRELEELKGRLPVVVLWGTRDRLITRDAFEEMCELLGRPQAVTVDGSHGWLMADPDAFAEVITNVVEIAAGPPLRPLRRFSRLGPMVQRIARRGRADRPSSQSAREPTSGLSFTTFSRLCRRVHNLFTTHRRMLKAWLISSPCSASSSSSP